MEGDQLSMGQSWNQAQNDTITAQLKADMASVNATMKSLGLKAENLYLGTVRDDPNNKDPSQRSVSLTDLLGKLQLRSDDSATFSQALSQGMPASFDSVASFQSAVTQLKSMADTVDALGVAVSKFNSDGTVTVSGFTEATGDLRTALDTMLNGKTVATSDLQSQVATITEFVSNTMPNLMKATVNGQQSWVEQMEALKKTYEAAATQASSYGLDGNALNDKFGALYEQGYAQNMQSLAESAQAFRVRYLTATGDDQGAVCGQGSGRRQTGRRRRRSPGQTGRRSRETSPRPGGQFRRLGHQLACRSHAWSEHVKRLSAFSGSAIQGRKRQLPEHDCGGPCG
ncbi:hypothetical protein [Asaia bogorensis]|uniref:hypothetical protein n=1 Tax=Asaia bogorensis TaxID=91915 RepID=UPI000EFABEAF|nr:hypothetical protein [Asaia bogorensis]